MSQTARRILYIEDEEAAQIGLRAVLVSQGHTVDVAENVGRAVELMRQTAYDLLLLDIMIDPGPVLNGVPSREAGKELLLRLRSGQFGPLQTKENVPVVAITAVADLGINRALQGAGVMEILPKPIDPEEACMRIQSMLTGEGGEQGGSREAMATPAEAGRRRTVAENHKKDMS
jgi:CheY-like chemotaxis protein